MRDTASMQRNADLRALLSRFEGARIAVVGDLVADEYVYGQTERISREAPVLIVRYESSDLKPGCGANAVANLCALGARVAPVGLVGDDATGDRLRRLLEEAGADVSGVLAAPGLPTATKTRVLAGGKNTRRQQMLRIDRDGPGVPASLLAAVLRAAFRYCLPACGDETGSRSAALCLSDPIRGAAPQCARPAVRNAAPRNSSTCRYRCGGPGPGARCP